MKKSCARLSRECLVVGGLELLLAFLLTFLSALSVVSLVVAEAFDFELSLLLELDVPTKAALSELFLFDDEADMFVYCTEGKQYCPSQRGDCEKPFDIDDCLGIIPPIQS